MDYDNLTICPVCGDQEMLNTQEMCGSCRHQKNIDESDWVPVMCNACHSTLVIQEDWRKPIYVCQMCEHRFVDPDGNWIDSEY